MKKVMKQSTMMLLMNVLSIVLIAAVALSFTVNSYFNRRIDQANTDRYDLTYNANRFMNGSSYLTDEVRAYASTGHQVHYDNYMNEVNVLKNRDIGVENLRKIGMTVEEEAMIQEMSSLSNELVPLEEDAMKATRAGDGEAALDYVYGTEYSQSIENISQIKTRFLESLDERSAANVERLAGICSALNVLVWCLIMVVVAVQIWISFYNRRRVIRPITKVVLEMAELSKGNLSTEFAMEPDTSEIGQLVQAIQTLKGTLQTYIQDIQNKLSRMATGDMDQLVDMTYIGDFAPIQQALNTILDSLNDTLSQIDVASGQVTAGADQVAQGAQNLSRGAMEQASSTEEISASVNELSERMDLIAGNAIQAKELSEGASDILKLANQKMDGLNSAMQEISSASTQISKIIDTIESIAFQTNILALNAAVEAARAGVAGKGFAVVADEVRNLASKSAEASKSTAALIESAIHAVDNGTSMAVDTAKTMADVVVGAKQSTSLVEEIAAASAEQTKALQRLLEGVDQVSGIVQTNSAAAEESAAAAEELNAQAVTLQALVDNFQLR